MIRMDVRQWLGEDNQIGIDIWHKKYQQGSETFDQWLNRVSGGNKELKQLIIDKKFMFGGRILSNRGLHKKGKKVTYSNCYVLEPPEDNIESIFECASKLARTFSYGGGVGIDISNLAPRGAVVNNTAKHTTGSVSFMDLYNMVTGLIGQNGRRGALMISLSCDHPDLEEFIEIKSDLDKITKANISIRITDDFIDDVITDSDYKLMYIREETGEVISKSVNAKKLFRKICEMNWNYAEPGILFWDNIEYWNLLDKDPEFSYAGTNPCAEEPLPAGGSCLLGSLNLAEFVNPDKTFDVEGFKKAVDISVRALNEVLDEGLELHPLQEQKDSVRDWRQIGLGIFGLADMFIKMGVKYGGETSKRISLNIGDLLINQALRTSAFLAKEYGTYPKYKEKAIFESDFFTRNARTETQEYVSKYGLRNSQLLTIAPTGTISTMLGVSGGIEPIFANYYTRKTESLHGEDTYYKVYTPIVKDYMDENDITDDADLPNYFVTAKDIDFKDRIDIQDMWQQHIDASISSTINLPHEATVDDVVDLYMYAWESGLKGVTVYRDGCARSGILTTDDKKEETIDIPVPEDKGPKRGEIIKAGNNSIGRKRTLQTGCGTLHCEAFFDPFTGDLLETYLSKGSTGGCNNFMIGLSRLISLSARAGVNVYDIVDQLQSCGTCPSYAVRRATKKDTSPGSSCPVAVGKALIDMYEEFKVGVDSVAEFLVQHDATKEDVTVIPRMPVIDGGTVLLNNLVSIEEHVMNDSLCPECLSPLVFEGGCNTCKNCGYSKCD